MPSLERYVNKSVPFKFRGQSMSFELSHALFSSFDIDKGSRLLLKAVSDAVQPESVGSILDIGSGVGVLGIACAKAYPGASLTLRDRDALACAFSERNARRNKVTPSSVDHALFLDGLEGREFDLVLCNVPAKAGPPVLDQFLRALPASLSSRGIGAIVVVNPIAEAALASLETSGASALRAESGTGHTAYIFGRASALDRTRGAPGNDFPASWLSACERTSSKERAGRRAYAVKGYWGLPEFDTPAYATSLVVDSFDRAVAGALVRRVAMLNPGVGRAAAHAAARVPGAVIDLCSRDALALAASAANISAATGSDGSAGLSVPFEDGLPDAAYDLIIAFPEEMPRVDPAPALWESAARTMKRGAVLLAAGGSTAMDRCGKARPKGFSRLFDTRKKGFVCAAWRKEE